MWLVAALETWIKDTDEDSPTATVSRSALLFCNLLLCSRLKKQVVFPTRKNNAKKSSAFYNGFTINDIQKQGTAQHVVVRRENIDKSNKRQVPSVCCSSTNSSHSFCRSEYLLTRLFAWNTHSSKKVSYMNAEEPLWVRSDTLGNAYLAIWGGW